MAFYDWGNPPLTSTQAAATNPSTATILAEVSSLVHANYVANVIVGASTLATFVVEQCLSSGLGSTALSTNAWALSPVTILGSVNQTGQYVVKFSADAGDRIRVRVGAAITGTAAATLQVEQQT